MGVGGAPGMREGSIVMKIALKDIIPAPWNPRADITPESVAEIAESIKAQGLINPVTLWRDGGGAWVCIAGNRRLAALRVVLGEDAEIDDTDYATFEGSEGEAKAITFSENHHREQITPLGEAAQIKGFLDSGLSIESAAAALGISASKARRRARLVSLADAWKSRTDLDVTVLERIATYPVDVQERVAKHLWSGAKTWREMATSFDLESRDLDTAKFCTGDCAACLKRTGVEADLFGVADGSLGRCLDKACFDARRDKWLEGEIAKATNGAKEVVRCDRSWDMPDEDETSTKQTKKHPCAYVLIGRDGVEKVMWGESPEVREAREAKEQAEREREAERDAKERERMGNITEALRDYCDTDEAREAIEEAVRDAIRSGEERAFDEAVRRCTDAICTWHSASGWAEVLRTFPAIAEVSGIDDDDLRYLLDAHPEKDDADDDEDEDE